ncbi:MAG: MFS transporter, partial [Polyangiales bacterium]
LYRAGVSKEWRDTLDTLSQKSQGSRVGGIWLLLNYLLATLGELCLSPVGLSMVTKLAPVRFASLFMGVWMLASSLAQYVGGSLGESWGIDPPKTYFTIFVATSFVGAVVLLVLVKPLTKMMHGVK